MRMNTIGAMTGAAILAMSVMSPACAQSPVNAQALFVEQMTRSALRLTQIPQIGLRGCGSMQESDANYSAPTVNQELVYNTRNGVRVITIEGFVNVRVESPEPQLDYWLAKIRLVNGKVELKDVTTTEAIGGALVAWVISEYAKDVVKAVLQALSTGTQYIYGILADEYISAGIARYDAVVEYAREPGVTGVNGLVRRVVLSCVR